MLPVSDSNANLSGYDKLGINIYLVALLIPLIGGTSLVLPGMFHHKEFISLHWKSVFILPFLLITVIFLCLARLNHNKNKWVANILGLIISFLPTYCFIYMACSPSADALAGGILVIFAFVSAPVGYALGWILVKLLVSI